MKTLVAPLFLAMCLVSVIGCDNDGFSQNKTSRQQTAWADYEKQCAESTKRQEAAWAQSAEIMKKQREMQERALKIMEGEEALLKRQGEQADRLDAILKKWEGMPLVSHQ